MPRPKISPRAEGDDTDRGRRAQPLLEAGFLERLRVLRGLIFRQRRGESRGSGFGQAPEFEANRPYNPGDDPRYIDWNLYARLEQLWVKLSSLENESQVGILVDTSASMSDPHPGKQLAAARSAAAFSYLALAAGRNLRLGSFAAGLLAARGPYRSLRQFPAALSFCAGLPSGTGTALARSIGEFLAGSRPTGVLVIVSDLLQEEPEVLRALEAIGTRDMGLHIVQVLEREELEPSFRGEFSIRDPEGEETLNLSVGDDLAADLRRRVLSYADGIEAFCRARGFPYLRAIASEPFADVFLGHLLGRRTTRGFGAAQS